MISSAMNEMILKLFDYASQGLPCLLDNLAPLLGCERLTLVDEQNGPEAANDIILLSETGWEPSSASHPGQALNSCADNPCCLILPLDKHLDIDFGESMLLVLNYTTAIAAEAALDNPDIQQLIPHIQQAVFIAREISEQIGDIQALQYVIQHHPLKSLFFNTVAMPCCISTCPQTLPAANQTFELEISKHSLSQHFKLSPSEIELAQALFKGLSLNEITEDRHVSKQTVRKQLQSILRKTGAQSQEALMLLMFDSCLLTRLETADKASMPMTGNLGTLPI